VHPKYRKLFGCAQLLVQTDSYCAPVIINEKVLLDSCAQFSIQIPRGSTVICITLKLLVPKPKGKCKSSESGETKYRVVKFNGLFTADCSEACDVQPLLITVETSTSSGIPVTQLCKHRNEPLVFTLNRNATPKTVRLLASASICVRSKRHCHIELEWSSKAGAQFVTPAGGRGGLETAFYAQLLYPTLNATLPSSDTITLRVVSRTKDGKTKELCSTSCDIVFR
jgi:hypothetical protein